MKCTPKVYPKQNEKCPKNDTETKQKMSKTKQPKTNIKTAISLDNKGFIRIGKGSKII